MESERLYSFVPLMRAAELSSLRGNPASIGAFNVNFYAQALGILEGLKRAQSPGIIQASKGANSFQGGPDRIQEMVLLAMDKSNHDLPICLHLDHGNLEAAVDCIDNGFSSVMIDASSSPENKNIETTKRVVDYAHPRGVGVEGEYGVLSGVEEDIVHQKSVYADPKFVPVFFDRSGADALAIAYGTSHGPNKGKTDALNVGIVRESYDALRAHKMNLDRFLVSHGSSTVPQELISELNFFGGNISGARGVPEYKLLEAIDSGIRKINIDTDLRMGITATFRRFFSENSGVEKASEPLGLIKRVFDGDYYKDGKPADPSRIIDPRDYLKPIVESRPELLRGDYHDSNDAVYIEVMDLVREKVSGHVYKLARLFGTEGLAKSVEKV
jgi:fructose-bisphosphate aldolase, class II